MELNKNNLSCIIEGALHIEDCTRYKDLICKSTNGPLTDIEDRRLHAHMLVCEECRLYNDDYLGIVQNIRSEIFREEPSEGFAGSLANKCAASLDKDFRRYKAAKRIRAYAYGSVIACFAITLIVFNDRVPLQAEAYAGIVPTPVQTLWKVPNIAAFKESRACTPVLCGGNVYTIEKYGPSGRIVAVNMKKGNIAWRSTLSATGYLSADSHQVYGVSMQQDMPVLRAFNSSTGTFSWEFSSKPGMAFDPSAPAIVGKTVYWSAGNSVYAISAQTGLRQWKKNLGANAVASRVCIYQESVLIASGEGVYCLATNGNVVWKHQFKEPMVLSVAPQLSQDNNRVFISHRSILGNSFLQCLDAASGTELWHLDDVDVRLMLAAEGRVFVRSRDLRSFDQQNGALQWRRTFDGCAPMTCAGHILYLTEAAEKGVLVSVDIQTGNIIKIYRTAGSCTGVLVSDSMKVVHSIDGTLYAFAGIPSS